MPNSTRKTGSQFLTRKSALGIARQNKPQFTDFLVVEDTPLDADRLKATLHSLFGYDITVRHAATLGAALDRVIERAPELVFLDDHLKPADNAAHTIPLLRRCNYAGHIIVVSGLLTRQRTALLKAAGASIAIHKDNLDSGSISEAIARIHDMEPILEINDDVLGDSAKSSPSAKSPADGTKANIKTENTAADPDIEISDKAPGDVKNSPGDSPNKDDPGKKAKRAKKA